MEHTYLPWLQSLPQPTCKHLPSSPRQDGPVRAEEVASTHGAAAGTAGKTQPRSAFRSRCSPVSQYGKQLYRIDPAQQRPGLQAESLGYGGTAGDAPRGSRVPSGSAREGEDCACKPPGAPVTPWTHRHAAAAAAASPLPAAASHHSPELLTPSTPAGRSWQPWPQATPPSLCRAALRSGRTMCCSPRQASTRARPAGSRPRSRGRRASSCSRRRAGGGRQRRARWRRPVPGRA